MDIERVVNVIPAVRGKLYMTCRGSRYALADCKAELELVEHSSGAPILGRGRIIRKWSLALLATFEHEPHAAAADTDGWDSIGFIGDFLRMDGKYEEIRLDHCLLQDDLDLTEAGRCTFEVCCSPEMLRRLRNL